MNRCRHHFHPTTGWDRGGKRRRCNVGELVQEGYELMGWMRKEWQIMFFHNGTPIIEIGVDFLPSFRNGTPHGLGQMVASAPSRQCPTRQRRRR